MFHWNGCRLFEDVDPEPNNGRWLLVTVRIEQGRLHSIASIRVLEGLNTQDSQNRRIHQGEQVASGWTLTDGGCGGEEDFAVGFGKGSETSRGAPVGPPDLGHEGFCG